MKVELLTHEDLESFKTDIVDTLCSIMDTRYKSRRWLKSEDVQEMLKLGRRLIFWATPDGFLKCTYP